MVGNRRGNFRAGQLYGIRPIKERMMRITIAVIFLVLATNVAIASDIVVPKGWRLPTDKDMTGDWAELRQKNLSPYLAQADFNGDGIRDDAYIALSTSGKSWALFVNLNKAKGNPKVIMLEKNPGATPPQRMGVRVAEPGAYETACEKGYWDCGKDAAETLTLELPGIDFYLIESVNSCFWWDKNLKKFRRTWISD